MELIFILRFEKLTRRQSEHFGEEKQVRPIQNARSCYRNGRRKQKK
jgi:hypothetical protein